MRRWEALADGCTDATVAIVMEKRRPQELQYGEWIARQQGKIERALQAMSEDLGNAQLVLRRLLQPVGHRGRLLPRLSRPAPARLDWRDAYPNLAKLADKLAQRPSFKDTVPPR